MTFRSLIYVFGLLTAALNWKLPIGRQTKVAVTVTGVSVMVAAEMPDYLREKADKKLARVRAESGDFFATVG